MKKAEAKDFRDIYFHEEGEKKVFCFRTGLTVYEEVFDGTRYTAAGWNTAGYTLNVLEDFPSRLDRDAFTEAQSFDIEADGVSLSWDWEYVGFESSEERLENGTLIAHGTLMLKSMVKPLVVKVHTVLDGTAIFERWLEVENTGAASINVNVVAPMCGGIEVLKPWRDYAFDSDPSKLWSLGYMDSSEHCHEGYFRWHDLPNAVYAVDGKYTSEMYRHPMFMLRNNAMGTIMIAQFGWSGGYRFEFTQDIDAGSGAAKLSFRTELKSQKPITCLLPGERFETPKMHVGMLSGDLDDAVNAMHGHLRKSVFTLPPARGVRGWVEGGIGPERTMDVAAMKHFADTIAAVGGETMIIDAGWYCPAGLESKEWHGRAGDWYFDADKHPNGIAEIRDYVHQKGLLFGLWLDLERLGSDSAAAKAHPEWISVRYKDGKKKSQLNMAIPEAAAWAESELTRVIDEYKIDLFRLDYNLGNSDLQTRYYGDGGVENGFVRYYRNTLAMYERLHRKYPNVIFENCAGGGGRTDVGFVRNFDHTWVSDHNVAPRSFTVTNGMTMALPPEYADRLVGGMGCHTAAELSWQARNAIFGRPTTNDYNAIGSKINPIQIETVKHAFDVYKRHIRPYIEGSRIFHHTPEVAVYGASIAEQPHGTGIIERCSGDGKHGVMGIFRLIRKGGAEDYVVYPKGIDVSLRYRVELDNDSQSFTLSGAEIRRLGIRVGLPASLTSELIIYTALDEEADNE